MALGSTQPLTEINIRNLPGSNGRPAGQADNLTAICQPIVWKNVGASTSYNPVAAGFCIRIHINTSRKFENTFKFSFNVVDTFSQSAT
jgi:hypothetical protein